MTTRMTDERLAEIRRYSEVGDTDRDLEVRALLAEVDALHAELAKVRDVLGSELKAVAGRADRLEKALRRTAQGRHAVHNVGGDWFPLEQCQHPDCIAARAALGEGE